MFLTTKLCLYVQESKNDTVESDVSLIYFWEVICLYLPLYVFWWDAWSLYSQADDGGESDGEADDAEDASKIDLNDDPVASVDDDVHVRA